MDVRITRDAANRTVTMDEGTFLALAGSAAHGVQGFMVAQSMGGPALLKASGHGDVHGLVHLHLDRKCGAEGCAYNDALSAAFLVFDAVARSVVCSECEKCGGEHLEAIYQRCPGIRPPVPVPAVRDPSSGSGNGSSSA